MEKENKREIKIGEVFFIDIIGLSTWYFNDDDFFFCASGNINGDEMSMLLAVKYLGNGIIEEMLTGEKILIDKFSNKNFKLEDDNDLACFAYADYYVEQVRNPKILTANDYIEELKQINLTALDNPLTFSMLDEYVHEVTDKSKKEYLLLSDNIRRNKIHMSKKQALIKTKNFIWTLTDFIYNFNFNDELVGDSIINEAYLENKLFDFKRKVK